jgi:hypothetical protein
VAGASRSQKGLMRKRYGQLLAVDGEWEERKDDLREGVVLYLAVGAGFGVGFGVGGTGEGKRLADRWHGR